MAHAYPTFRGLLRGAICRRTQAQFANECGLSAGHLNRMLNAPQIRRPTRNTLIKLASAAKNGITLQDFENALDQDDGNKSHPSIWEADDAARDFAPDFEDAANEAMARLVKTISDTTYPVIADSIAAHVEDLLAASRGPDAKDLPEIAYDVGIDRGNFGSYYPAAARYVLVQLSMADAMNTGSAHMMVYFTELPCGDGTVKAVIQHVSCTAEAYEDQFGFLPEDLAMANAEAEAFANAKTPEDFKKLQEEQDAKSEEADRISALGYRLHFSPVERFKERYIPEEGTIGENVMNSLFGKEFRWPETIDGLGFETGGEPPQALARFLWNHAKHIRDNYDLPGMEPEEAKESLAKLDAALDLARTGDSNGAAKALDAMEYHDADFADDPGWPSAVASVMRAETGFPVVYHAPAKDLSEFPGLSATGCIMATRSEWESQHARRESILNALFRYASYLGIPTVADMLFTGVHVTYRKPMSYHMRESTPEEDSPEEDNGDIDTSGWTDFDPETGPWPEHNSRHLVELKDGRIISAIHFMTTALRLRHAWLGRCKDWSRMVAKFDPEPIPDDEGHDEGQ